MRAGLIDEPVILERIRPGTMWCWATAQHLPEPIRVGDRWRCSRCRLLLTRYISRQGQRRLRHHPRGRFGYG